MMPVSVSKCSGSGPAPAPAAAAASSRAQALAPFVASTFTPPNLLRQLPGEGGIGAPPPLGCTGLANIGHENAG